MPAVRRDAPVTCSPGKEVIVTRNRKIGAGIALATAMLAAAGLLIGFFNIQPAAGLAVVGIVIGTGVARGAFSVTPDATKRN